MERTTEENTSVYDGEHLLKEIEVNFKQILKSTPSEIEDDINNAIANLEKTYKLEWLPNLFIAPDSDKFMLKHMIDEAEVGYYSTACSLCNTWVFILSAIIDSMYPVIMESHKNNYLKYEQQNRLMYAIVFYISVFVSLLFVIFASPVIRLLYGEAYMPSVAPLQVITWYVAFSYLGVARNAWIVSENLQKYITPIYAGAAITNVVINYLLIPVWGATGAAIASLITQVSTIFFFPLFIKPMRKNTKLLAEALFLKGIK